MSNPEDGKVFRPGKKAPGWGMRAWLVILTVVLWMDVARAEAFEIPSTKAVITMPAGWVRDEENGQGYGLLLKERLEDQRKIRLHNAKANEEHLGLEAYAKTQWVWTNEKRKERTHPPEGIVSSTPIETKSGLKGWRLVVSNSEGQPGYLARCYFSTGETSMLCACVYFYGDEDFARKSERLIIAKLRLGR